MGAHCCKNHGDGYEKIRGNELDFIGAVDGSGNRHVDLGAFRHPGAASALCRRGESVARFQPDLGELIRIPILRGIA